MKTGIVEIVHIIPITDNPSTLLASYNFLAADRAYIIAQSNHSVQSAIIQNLKKRNISASVVHADNMEGLPLMKTVAHLIRIEKETGAKLYLNISGCDNIGAVYLSLAGTALGAEVYYLVDSPDGVETSVLPKVDIQIPDRTELKIMVKMYKAENYALSASEIAEVVYDEDLLSGAPDTGKREKTRKLMNVSYLMKQMREKGYVKMEKTGRKMIYSLTDRGEFMLILSGEIE